MRHFIITIIALLLTTLVEANSFEYRQLSPIATPHSEELHCLYFDRQGMMWIGTNVGLKSYDGYNMQTIKAGVYTPGVFPNNDILCITEDHRENLWLGTRNGLVKMDMRNGETTIYHELRTVYTLFTSKDGTVWIGTDNGLSRYLPEEDRILTYDHTNTTTILPNGQKTKTLRYGVKAIIEDNQGNLFVGTWTHSLLRMDSKRKVFYRYPHFNHKGSAYSLCMDSTGKLWVGTWGYGLVRLNHPYDHKDPQAQQLPYSAKVFNTFYKLVEDPISKTIWASSREGIAIVDIKQANPEVKTYTNIGGNQLAFANHLATDGNGNLWVGTANNGIMQFNTHPSLFPQFQLNDDAFTTYIHSVNSLYTPDGRYVWISILPFGIACHDIQTGTTYVNRQIQGMENMTDNIMGSSFMCFEKRQNGELWMGNWAGIVVRDPNKKCHVIDVRKVNYLAENCINSLRQAKNGTMWIGQRSGISVVYPNGKGFLLQPKEGNQTLKECDVRGIMEDKAGNIWLATDNMGIIRVSNTHKGHDKFQYKQYAPQRKNFIVNDAINCLQDREGRIWAISNSGGLFLYDKKKDRFDAKNREYLIDSERILAINEDNQGNLWLTEDLKLTKLSLAGGKPQITSYGKDDGLQDIFFTINATTKHGDHLFFNTQKGYFIVDSRQIANVRHQKYNLAVTNIYIDNTPIANIDSVTRHKITSMSPRYTQKLTIPDGIRNFEVEFALLTYANTEQNKYAYKLEGYHDDWQYSGCDTRRATFWDLPAGTYKLHIKAADNFGKWIELPYTITVKVLPPWYATWWAYLIYITLALVAIFLVIKWYKNHLKTKNRLQMQVIFTNITHELLTPLTVILAAIDELRQKAPEHEGNYQLMQNNITRVTHLLREILEVRKAQAGQLKLLVAEGDIAQFLRTTCENLRPMAGFHHVDFNINIPEQEIWGWFDIDKMDKIVYNLLSNAFKYNQEKGHVDISLTVKAGRAIIKIADSGIGISIEKQRKLYTRFLDGDYRKEGTTGTGIGLSLTFDLVKLHHGDIDCQSEKGKGTTFTVTIPLNKREYRPEEIDETHKPKAVEKKFIQHIEKEMYEEDEQDEEGERYRILLVEDNEQLLQTMKRMLSKRYQVLTARDGKQALHTIMKEPLDVVVSDVMMPVMDGIELTHHIKQEPNYKQLPIILLTAMTREEDRDKAYASGADEYITKPFRMTSLKRRIDNIIENRQRIRERFTAQKDFKVEEQHYSSPDEAFVQTAINCVKEHMADSEYDRQKFATDMYMSGSTLYNKLRALTGQTVVGFIASIRLKEAYQILQQDPEKPVHEVAAMVGFNSPKYFSKCFKKEFGILPREFNDKEETGES